VTKLLLTVVLIVSSVSPLLAQSTTEEVAVRYYQSISDGRWSDVASLLHDDAKSKLKEAVLHAVESLPDSAHTIPGGRISQNSKSSALVLLEVTSIEELELLPAESVVDRLFSIPGRRKGAVSQFLTSIESQVSSEIIGTLLEGSDLAHVVRRVRIQDESENVTWDNGVRRDVLTLKLENGQWKVWLDSAVPLTFTVRAMITTSYH
jgi:hypothetical protein